MGSLHVIELQLVAFIVVFSACGLIPLIGLAFPAFTTLYFLALSCLAFPSLPTSSSSASSIYDAGGGVLFRPYVVLGTIVGLFLPLVHVLGGFARGDETAVRAAVPHLFLLALQILTENAISGLGVFSPLVRTLVPTVHTVCRVFVVLDWAKDAWLNKSLPAIYQLPLCIAAPLSYCLVQTASPADQFWRGHDSRPLAHRQRSIYKLSRHQLSTAPRLRLPHDIMTDISFKPTLHRSLRPRDIGILPQVSRCKLLVFVQLTSSLFLWTQMPLLDAVQPAYLLAELPIMLRLVDRLPIRLFTCCVLNTLYRVHELCCLQRYLLMI